MSPEENNKRPPRIAVVEPYAPAPVASASFPAAVVKAPSNVKRLRCAVVDGAKNFTVPSNPSPVELPTLDVAEPFRHMPVVGPPDDDPSPVNVPPMDTIPAPH